MTPHAARDYVCAHRNSLFAILQDLIRLPSENRSPLGSEAACQAYLADRLRRSGYEPQLYRPDEVAALAGHELATPNRSYPDRHNLVVRHRGAGGGRSLLLSGHIDTVPAGSLPWTRDPFDPLHRGNRIYGRGANDMKAGIAMNLFLMEARADLGANLGGDLLMESVVDEEFGGVNGTLAARLRGDWADAAILTEPSSLRICAAQRGGRTAHLRFRAGGGILSGPRGGTVVDQLTHFLTALPSFARERRSACNAHPLYAALTDPVPVTVTKITTGPWGTAEPITVPEQARVELYWQTMPGEQQLQVDAEFLGWIDRLIASAGPTFAQPPEITFALRWLPGSATAPDSELCRGLQASGHAVLGTTPPVVGIEGPCDLFLFHHFGIPAVLWGSSGGQTHGSDEFVDTDSLLDATSTLLHFLFDWCA